ncbi:ser-Asp rich fibrinogen/bone sialoprotein-binding protein SdrE_1, partial [Staphylococcus aureus]
MRFQKIEYQR